MNPSPSANASCADPIRKHAMSHPTATSRFAPRSGHVASSHSTSPEGAKPAVMPVRRSYGAEPSSRGARGGVDPAEEVSPDFATRVVTL